VTKWLGSSPCDQQTADAMAIKYNPRQVASVTKQYMCSDALQLGS